MKITLVDETEKEEPVKQDDPIKDEKIHTPPVEVVKDKSEKTNGGTVVAVVVVVVVVIILIIVAFLTYGKKRDKEETTN